MCAQKIYTELCDQTGVKQLLHKRLPLQDSCN